MQTDVNNLIEATTVIAVHASHSRVKVDVMGRPTDWLPVLQQANAFKKQFIPLRTGEQVLVLCHCFALRGIFNQTCKEPAGSGSHIDITEYEDGTRIKYDTKNKVLTINAVGRIQVSAPEIHISGVSGDVIVDGISLVHHTHPQNPGDHFGGGTDTGKAQ